MLQVDGLANPFTDDVYRRSYFFIGFYTEYPEKELLKVITVPPAIHIRLSKTKVSLGDGSTEYTGVVYLDVPPSITIDTDICRLEDAFQPYFPSKL